MLDTILNITTQGSTGVIDNKSPLCFEEEAKTVFSQFYTEQGADHLKDGKQKVKQTYDIAFLTCCLSVRGGYIKRNLDPEIKASVIELVGTNMNMNYIVLPKENKKLAITLPILVLIVKNLGKTFSFEITIKDDKGVHRRFRASNTQKEAKTTDFSTAMPIRLKEGWNQIQLHLADFTRAAYGTNYIKTDRIQVSASIAIRRIYFSDRMYSEEETPPEFRLKLPTEKHQQEDEVEQDGKDQYEGLNLDENIAKNEIEA